LGEVTSVDVDLRLLAGAVGAATAVAGVLAILRLREDVVGAVLGALTAAAFTLGATSLLQPTSGWRVMYPAAIFGALLLGFLVFRRGFDRPGCDGLTARRGRLRTPMSSSAARMPVAEAAVPWVG
jgi:hypothetical protein